MIEPVRVLFICLGNICRSPTAEAVMNSVIRKNKLQDRIICDSAGTSGLHEGEESDPRTIAHAAKRGHDVTSISRPFRKIRDFKEFDYIITMDDLNFEDVSALDAQKAHGTKIFKMTQFCTTQKHKEVPDPYYGGPDGFELVIDILEDACQGLLEKIRTDRKF